LFERLSHSRQRRHRRSAHAWQRGLRADKCGLDPWWFGRPACDHV